MKRRLLDILLLLAAALLSWGCMEEKFESPSDVEEGEADCVLTFGSPAGAHVEVSTKASLGLAQESNVFNIYLLIFEGNSASSKKIYGHFFDGSNLNADSENNYWTVTNMSKDSDSATNGTIHFRTAKKAGCTIVAVANMNPDDLDVSQGRLSTIQTYGELQGIVATQVRSEVAANSGYFLMTAQTDGVNIQGNTSDANDVSKKSLLLKRIYAKVTVNVRIAQGANIRSFAPDKWQVFNIPTCSYLLERTGDDAADTEAEFFNTDALGFETETVSKVSGDVYADGKDTPVSIHSFSFYMMENRKAPSSGITTYADRERREKPASYNGGFFQNGDYLYTDPLSAYFTITGKLQMAVSAGGNDNATLDANVKYEVHLGNFSSDVTDFDTERNHSYVYNIYINGAEDIKAEVEAFDSSTPLAENEPGATGRVVVALEEVFNSDCHYSTQVISFHVNYMDPDNISWYVETPFNPDGIGPEEVADLSMIDYKWVEFHVNDKAQDGTYYSNKRVVYLPHDYNFVDIDGNALDRLDKGRTMYVDELVDYLKAQKRQYEADQLALASDPSYVPKSDFDNDNSGTGGPKISVTAFVSEYYYTVNPLTGEYDPALWKNIVNHPMRRMHILASSAKSADGESDLIGASFTIQQRAIQSIYAVHETAGLESAWGMEFSDDDHETGGGKYWVNKNMEDCGNTSATNGRINSMKIWGILDKNGNDALVGERWDTFLNLTGTNETAQLKEEYNYLRYSCMSRNRDNDGDGIIDRDEIRWYMASDIQLMGVFLGSYGIEGDARLYQRSANDQNNGSDEVWRQHIISSNRYSYTQNPPNDWNNSNKYPRVVWAEEGVNGSNLDYSGAGKTTKFSTRCVRNLGYYVEGGQRKDITLAEDPNVEPVPYTTVIRKHLNTDGTVTSPYTGAYDDRTFYVFDCSRINLASIREPVEGHELVGHDENSKMACLSTAFETAPAVNLITVNSRTFNGKSYNLKVINTLNDYLDASFPNLDAGFRVCPEGYRLPNVREMSLIWTELSSMDTGDSVYLGDMNDSNVSHCRTHWSKGSGSTSPKVTTQWGWAMSGKHLLMAGTQNSSKPRCVKDVTL